MNAIPIGHEQLAEQLPASLAAMMNWERFNLHRPERFRCNSSELDFDIRFTPPSCTPFLLPCFWIGRRHFYRYTMESPKRDDLSVFGISLEGENILYPIHPAEIDQYSDFLSRVNARNASADGLLIWAVPTSSVRTLLVWPSYDPNQSLFVKLPLHCRAFGGRHLSRASVARGVGISMLLRSSSPPLPTGVCYLFEAAGIVPRIRPNSGVLFRPLPDKLRSGDLFLAPVFSLVGHSANSPPLLLAILEKARMTFREFMQEVICSRFAKAWVELSMRHGLMLEAHGQNLLLALSPTLEPLGPFYYRDFQDLAVDWDLRRLTGISAPPTLPNAWSWHETYDCNIHLWNLVSAQLQISIGHYLRFVIEEMELAVHEWRQSGFHQTGDFAVGEFTNFFSHEIVNALNELFDAHIAADYNIYRNSGAFAQLLLKVRTQLIARHA